MMAGLLAHMPHYNDIYASGMGKVAKGLQKPV